MEILSFYQARTVVALYNGCRNARAVARQLKLPYQSVYDLACWLWDHAYPREVDLVSSRPVKQLLPDLVKPVYLAYLYSRDVSVEDAAKSVNWQPEEVARTCHGQKAWARTKNRPPVLPKKREPRCPIPEPEIPEDEIYRRALELRMQRPDDFKHAQTASRIFTACK
jgi:hypothetical protein